MSQPPEEEKPKEWWECEPERIILSDEDFDRLMEILEKPPEPSPALVELFRRGNERRKIKYEG